MSKKQSPPMIYQLKVTLQYSKPPIWRRLEVPGNTSLAKLHDIIQLAMGWTDSHLHWFIFGEKRYSNPDFQLDDVVDEGQITLADLGFEPKRRFEYEYDFGDGWGHDILIEKVTEPEPEVRYPRCVKGKLACPPDDCGGIGGYYALLDAISDPNNPEHENMLEWIGGEYDPEMFDLAAVNKQLWSLR